VFDAVREWAARMHRECALDGKPQTWAGGRPYVDHLDAVVAVLRRFGYGDEQNSLHQCLMLAGLGHDLREDTRAGLIQIRVFLGPAVLTLIEAVTNEPGENRAERHLKTYPKIAATPWATMVKLADRIANIEASIGQPTNHLGMYKAEHPGFRAALYVPGRPEEPMWQALDALLGFEAAEAPLPVPAEVQEPAVEPLAVESVELVESNPVPVESSVESSGPAPGPVGAVAEMAIPAPVVAIEPTPWF
jgi:hypothetical protein